MRDVAERLEELLVGRLEKEHVGETILLVAHGDTLSILWALARRAALQTHRDVALQTGELRQLHTLK